MERPNAISWSAVVYRALTAGIAGAITIQLYLYLTTVLPVRSNMIAAWQYVASVVVGNAAFTSSSYALMGIAISLAAGAGWAGGYAYFCSTRPSTNRHWLAAGAAYGVVVYVLTQLILLAGGHFVGPATPNAFVNQVIAYVAFFGIPVAYAVRVLSREA